ncbi:carboxymuconolactone decarboxylase family protein [Blastopirellula sp. JC732]|uniref:Carboxymuconolactone decarboxylase family protein n=1 Tax=Blastopirellula sediminis TaxID=2894196 RepID=A0A9X1MH82_9BACT|nr:carboxymuconolactone decarboxylase family protein [Blastopirellula sediminis]MCC9604414.1 carboxymuconolactone decarboxylase family protein [Blastopirellula sediminis]MCC9626934.1 carboxymuconolactone decarboxylase family protein [Blastopirellula sediminis]
MEKSKWVKISEELPAVVGELNRGLPEFGAAFVGIQKAVCKDGALSYKTKELIAAALAIASRCEGCISYHLKACADLGATREEILEVASVAVMMGGGPSHYYGSQAVKAFDDFVAQKKPVCQA